MSTAITSDFESGSGSDGSAGSRWPDDVAPDARVMADRLIEAEQVHQEILDETLTAAEHGQIRESGRTACGDQRKLLEPTKRYPKAVNLQSCPRTAAGIWHTHVTAEELRHPEHSLPDWALVAYGDVDASMVVGYQTGEVIVGPERRETMVAAFEDAIGVAAGSPTGVVDALARGDIASPAQTRERVRDRLDPYVTRVSTGYGSFETRATAADLPAFDPSYPYQQLPAARGPDVGNLRRSAQSANDSLAGIVDGFGLKGTVVNSAVGAIIGTAVTSALFNQ